MHERKIERKNEKLTFREARKIVLKKAWQRLKEAEKKGKPIMHEDLARVQKEEWKKLKKEFEKNESNGDK
jgi:hypothetical protein